MLGFKVVLSSSVSPSAADFGVVKSCGLDELGFAVFQVTRGSWKLDSKAMGSGLRASTVSDIGVLAGVRGRALA